MKKLILSRIGRFVTIIAILFLPFVGFRMVAYSELPIDLKFGEYLKFLNFLFMIREGTNLAKNKNSKDNLEPP